MRRKIFTVQYLRFNRQLTALQSGKIDVVKRLAREAKRELDFKNNLNQLEFSIPAYDHRARN